VSCWELNIRTHQRANSELVGKVIAVEDERSASARLVATQEMAVDDRGLIHGGFAFGLADLAAMVLVNQPNVVLAGAEIRYLAPVKVGDEMVADASLMSKEGNRFIVGVRVRVGDRRVAEGTFNCVVPRRHVLEKKVSQ
jgi:acyl-coenzyme A thioesterase PaaI-like protein